MFKGIFITGTDTGVGKTFVACGLAALLRDSGYRVGVMKPAESGCDERAGKLFPQDAALLKEASGCEVPLEQICAYPLREPLAPSTAAERQNVAIDIGKLMDIYDQISSSHDVTLVEGAGGLMVPLLPSYTYADFARVLGLPLIVVAANRLGAINHTLLTLEHARCKGLRVLGYALNQLEASGSPAAETNRESLSALNCAPCLGEIPYIDGAANRNPELAELFAEHFDTRLLAAALR